MTLSSVPCLSSANGVRLRSYVRRLIKGHSALLDLLRHSGAEYTMAGYMLHSVDEYADDLEDCLRGNGVIGRHALKISAITRQMRYALKETALSHESVDAIASVLALLGQLGY